MNEVDDSIQVKEESKHDPLGGSCNACGSENVFGMSRVVGYYRPVQNWNHGKKAEFNERLHFSATKSMAGAEKMVKAEPEPVCTTC